MNWWTLKTFFGRPEHILDFWLTKSERSTYTRTDWNQSLILPWQYVIHAQLWKPATWLLILTTQCFCASLLISCSRNRIWTESYTVIPVVKSFSDWLYKLAEAASTVIIGPSSRSSSVSTHTQDHNAMDNQIEKPLQAPHARCVSPLNIKLPSARNFRC